MIRIRPNLEWDLRRYTWGPAWRFIQIGVLEDWVLMLWFCVPFVALRIRVMYHWVDKAPKEPMQ